MEFESLIEWGLEIPRDYHTVKGGEECQYIRTNVMATMEKPGEYPATMWTGQARKSDTKKEALRPREKLWNMSMNLWLINPEISICHL